MSKPVPIETKKEEESSCSIALSRHPMAIGKKKKSVLAGLSCTEWQDILQLEAVIKQVEALPGKSQSNIFSHVDWKTHIAAAGSRLTDNI